MIGPDTAVMRKFLYSLVNWSNIKRVLDLGCGTGYDLYEISKLTNPHVLLVGLDSSTQSIEQALSDAKKTERFSFSVSDITSALQFPDEQFDVVFSNNVLECIPEKARFLQEIHRVLKQDGQFLCAHFDWDSQVINGSDKSLIRKIVHSFADWQQPWMRHSDGWMGRRLWSAVHTTGFFDGRMSAYVLNNTKYESPYYGHARIQDFAHLVKVGLIDALEYQSFLNNIESLASTNEYFYSITMFAYLGRKVPLTV